MERRVRRQGDRGRVVRQNGFRVRVDQFVSGRRGETGGGWREGVLL